jgi:hypothetical protein
MAEPEIAAGTQQAAHLVANVTMVDVKLMVGRFRLADAAGAVLRRL